MRKLLKRTIQAAFAILVFPAAALSGFGSVSPVYVFFAHLFALVPGALGEFCRAAYYRQTLRRCSADVVIGFGTFFSRSDAEVANNVSIGAYCVIGCAAIGEWTQISSHVEIPSGRYQHARDDSGNLAGGSMDSTVRIGPHCWIGASAIVMADVGARSTVGAGGVVVKDIPANSVAVGNPARVIRTHES